MMNPPELRIDAPRRLLRRVVKNPDARNETAVVQRLPVPPARDASIEAAFAQPAPRVDALRRQIASEHLFAGRAEIEIVHGDAVYRLRRTSLGKLILTK